jgi:iron-sulfur cluster assembly protein
MAVSVPDLRRSEPPRRRQASVQARGASEVAFAEASDCPLSRGVAGRRIRPGTERIGAERPHGDEREETTVLVLTAQAATVIEEILSESDAGPDGGLRISCSTDGNGSAELDFALSDAPADGEEVVRDGGATVFLDEVAAAVLDDKTLDVEAHDDHFHFSLT